MTAIRRVTGTTVLVLIGLVLLPRVTWGQKFYPDDPLTREPLPLPAPDPGTQNFSVLLEAVSGTFSRPGQRHQGNRVVASQGVNTLGEVPDGPWYVNRHWRIA